MIMVEDGIVVPLLLLACGDKRILHTYGGVLAEDRQL